ncbi:MAG TPA: alpha-amylase family glycosyl hydrolase [Polyangiaceae bacterium]
MTNLLEERTRKFLLWRPAANTGTVPKLVIGKFLSGNPSTIVQEQSLKLRQSAAFADVWELPIADAKLSDGVYHYWFEVANTKPGSAKTIRVPDPYGTALDYRVRSDQEGYPASVVKIENGRVIACDPDGRVATVAAPNLAKLASNNKLVIYELPTSWSRGGVEPGSTEYRDVGAFQDVLALLDKTEMGGNFADLAQVSQGQHIADLGVNALELLPVTDALVDREWGYAPAHYFAPDADLGTPNGFATPEPNVGYAAVVNKCHELGIRVFADMVMAFGYDPYRHINFSEFHIDPASERSNPDAYQSSRNGELRDPFGGASWRYQSSVTGFDPVSGTQGTYCPAQQFMYGQLARWMTDYRIDGIRIDSVNNIASWNFIQGFRNAAHALWAKQWPDASVADLNAKFTVVGEELVVPNALIYQQRLDGLWNEHFQSRVRAAILGQGYGDDFEWTVRKMIDCRYLGFNDGAQAINYLTSHDTEGFRKERLYNFLDNNGIGQKEERIKLAFACLLTAVGVPMILAGEEFADQHDRKTIHPDKQRDAVNFERMNHEWRRRIYKYVARLVDLRKTAAALSVNDTSFIHSDFTNGRRVLAWVRGRPGIEDPVVVVANFSDAWWTGEYLVRNWPATPRGKRWREFTQGVDVATPSNGACNVPQSPWQARVFGVVG